MELIYRTLLFIHVCAGFSALSLFFVPAVARKGSKLHNQIGRWYVRFMWVVLLTAALLSVYMGVLGQWKYGVFFGFLSLLLSQPLYFGVVILRHKRGLPNRLKSLKYGLSWLILVAAVVLLVLGSGLPMGEGTDPLLLAFGFIGCFSGVTGLRSEQGSGAENWLLDHLRGMIVTAVGAFTAFFAFGGRRLFGDVLTGNWELIPWVAPTVIGILAIQWWKRKLGAAPRIKHQRQATNQKPKELAG